MDFQFRRRWAKQIFKMVAMAANGFKLDQNLAPFDLQVVSGPYILPRFELNGLLVQEKKGKKKNKRPTGHDSLTWVT